MAFGKDSDVHRRRFGRNAGVALSLIALAMILFGLTLAKVGGPEPPGMDYVPQTSTQDLAQPSPQDTQP